MGVRINKVLGYGITDSHKPRWTLQNLLQKPIRDEHTFDGDLAGWKTWLEEKDLGGDKTLELARIETLHSIHDALANNQELADQFAYNPMEKIPKVLILIPIGTTEFSRLNDTIDYLEWNNKKCSYRDEITRLTRPIPPFDEYMDKRTGKILDSRFMNRHRMGASTYNEELYHANGFSSYFVATLNIVPNIPYCIRWMVEYMNLFNEPETILNLRPMIYTYWA